MNQKLFLIINAIAVFIILLFFLRIKKRSEPTQLNLSGKKKPELPAAHSDENSTESADGITRNINVIFQYNGHSWDAYEVLGIPAGTSKGGAEKAFDRIMKTSDKQTHEFYKAAIIAIRKS